MGGDFKSKVKAVLESLDRTIYVGDRLKSNLTALTFAGSVSTALGLILAVVNYFTGDTAMFIASMVTVIAGVGCVFCTKVLYDRELAIQIPTIFCMVVITVYIITGAADGSAMLWAIMIPIGMCYFVSVKNGIILSAYYSLVFVIVFYTPLREYVKAYYTKGFMERFPLLYICLSLFTGMAMVQYHRKALFEIDYANKLSEEVAKQTAVAEERSRKIEQISIETIQALAQAIDAKDPYTRGHSTRVSDYSVKIAEALQWDKERINELKLSALLHDIGKIGVPDSILNNPRRLTDVEYDIIKSHTTMGGDILKGKVTIAIAEDVARSHHERYDGCGYPRGLKGIQISEEARIVAVADSFDAMSSNRVYRKACDEQHIRKELLAGKGHQFDPHFVDVFIELWDKGELASIMKDDTAADEENARISSAIMRSELESFLSKNNSYSSDKEDVDSGDAEMGSGNFTKLFDFLSEQEQSFAYPFDAVTINLDAAGIEKDHKEELEKSMYYMEQSIRQNIRDVDITTRYGNSHFLVIIIGANTDGTKVVIDKIFRGYYKMNGSGAYLPSYEIPRKEALTLS